MRRLGLALALAAHLVVPAAAQQAAPAGAPELLEIVEPNLEGVDPAVARQIGEHLETIRQLRGRPDVTPTEMAAAYGNLGELLFLYEILVPAETAFVNASRLMPQFHRWHYFLGALTQELRRLDEARQHFGRVLEIDETYLPALIRLGQVETLDNQTEAAKVWYRKALEVLPGSPAAHWGLGQIAQGEKDAAAAVEHFEAVLESQPQATAVHYSLGLAYRDLGDREKAREHLALRGDRAVKAADPLVDGLTQRVAGSSMFMLRGNQAFSRQNWEMAAIAYGKAVEADPENVVARHAYASALSRQGKLQEAREQLEWIVAEAPDDGVAQYNLATLYSQLQMRDKAFEHFQRSVEISPDLANAHYNLGVLLEQAGEVEKAFEEYRIARELNPQDTGAIIRHSVIAARTGRGEQAEADLAAILEVNPGDAEARLAMGNVLETLGREDEALEQYARAAEATEDRQVRARAHYAAGQMELERNRIESSIEKLAVTVDLMPGVAEARSLLATAMARGGYLTDAAEQYELIIRQSPGFRPAHHGRVMALLLGRRDAEAASSAQASLTTLPDEVELAHILARILATSEDAAVRDGERALQLAQQVMQQEQSLQHAETIAMALAELGRFDEAVNLQTQVRQRAAELPGLNLSGIEARLASYQRGEPVRAPWFGPN